MSNIEPDIIDPTKAPDGPPPSIDPEKDDLVEPDDIREPSPSPPIEPDPEESGQRAPSIRS